MEEKSQAPALDKGIAILRALEGGQPMTLDQLAQRVGAPKSSLLRFLDTLIHNDLVERLDQQKAYRALARLAWLDEDNTLRTRQSTMEALARQTGHTVEWYLPNEMGQTLMERVEPPQAELSINAHIGFLRSWTKELEAVNTVGLALCPMAPKALPALCAYNDQSEMVPIDVDLAAARVDQSREAKGYLDPVFNQNGVRRMASAVFLDGRYSGALALAEIQQVSVPLDSQTCFQQLLNAASQLST